MRKFAKGKNRKKFKRIIAFVLAFVLVGGAVALSIIFHDEEENKINFEIMDTRLKYNEEYYEPNSDRTNVLLIGIDAEEFVDSEKVTSGYFADFLCLISINRRDKTCFGVQINRDTIATKVPIRYKSGRLSEETMQICYAYNCGGENVKTYCNNTVDAVSRLFYGIRIHYYVALNFSSISVINDFVGGVPVKIDDDFSHIDETMKKGEVITLQGKQAEYFVRSRKAVANDPTNVNRINRQKQYMEGFIEKFKTTDKSLIDLFKELSNQPKNSLQTNINSALLMDASDYEFEKFYIPYAYASKKAYEDREIGTEPEDGYYGYLSVSAKRLMEFHLVEDGLRKFLTQTLFVLD